MPAGADCSEVEARVRRPARPPASSSSSPCPCRACREVEGVPRAPPENWGDPLKVPDRGGGGPPPHRPLERYRNSVHPAKYAFEPRGTGAASDLRQCNFEVKRKLAEDECNDEDRRGGGIALYTRVADASGPRRMPSRAANSSEKLLRAGAAHGIRRGTRHSARANPLAACPWLLHLDVRNSRDGISWYMQVASPRNRDDGLAGGHHCIQADYGDGPDRRSEVMATELSGLLCSRGS